MKIQNFYDLDCWKVAHTLSLKVYEITKKFPKEELFGITNQLRRAASSVSANISEGYGRYHFKDKIRFYYTARGSIAEVQNFLFLSRDLKYLSNVDAKEVMLLSNKARQLLNGLIRSTSKPV